MTNEKQYYEFDGFWNDYETSYKNNIEKINITFDFIREDVHTILDAACGNGIFTNMLIKKFPALKVKAFDRSEAALKYVQAEKLVAEIDNIPFEDKSFDCVIAHDVIEHLPVPVYEKAIVELARVSGKYIIIGTPHDETVMDRSTQCPSCKAIFNYDLHMRSFSQAAMRNLFSSFGFECNEIRTCDTITQYIGQDLYGKIMYPKFNGRFKSPICPICGYVDPVTATAADQSANNKPKNSLFVEYMKKIPKLIWPKHSFEYEMVALFERTKLN